jgi:hypothetical protein
MKILQPVLLATMISSAVFLLIGSAGIEGPAEDPVKMCRFYACESSDRTAMEYCEQQVFTGTAAGKPADTGSAIFQPAAGDPSAAPAAHISQSSGSATSYNLGAGYRGRPQKPLKKEIATQGNPNHSRIIQSVLQPIDLTINPAMIPAPVSTIILTNL